jgi:non-specific serine/threonine protein kinase
LVTTTRGRGGGRRYRLLDSLRQYGLDKLRTAGGEAEARRRHAVHYMEFAVGIDVRLHGHDATDGSARLVLELSNLRAALDWCFSGGDLQVGVELAGALRWWFFGRFGRLDRARAWLEDALARTDELPPALRLKALVAVMTVAFSQGDYRGASERGEEAVALAQELDDHRELAVALMARGGAAVFEGKLDRAVECLDRSMAYCDELGDRWGRAWVLTFWGIASRRGGDQVRARAQLEEALSIFRAARDDLNQVIPLAQLALVAQQSGDLDGAAQFCQDAIALARRLGDRELAYGTSCVYGLVQLARGRREEARELLLYTLGRSRGMENQLVVALALEGLAIVAHEEGRDTDGLVLWGYTDRLRSELVIPLPENRRAERERYLARARARMGDDEVERGLDAGRGLTAVEVRLRVGASGSSGD